MLCSGVWLLVHKAENTSRGHEVVGHGGGGKGSHLGSSCLKSNFDIKNTTKESGDSRYREKRIVHENKTRHSYGIKRTCVVESFILWGSCSCSYWNKAGSRSWAGLTLQALSWCCSPSEQAAFIGGGKFIFGEAGDQGQSCTSYRRLELLPFCCCCCGCCCCGWCCCCFRCCGCCSVVVVIATAVVVVVVAAVVVVGLLVVVVVVLIVVFYLRYYHQL